MNDIQNDTVTRKISRTLGAMRAAHDELKQYGRIGDSTLATMELQAEKLADYCRHVRRSRNAKHIVNDMAQRVAEFEPKQAG